MNYQYFSLITFTKHNSQPNTDGVVIISDNVKGCMSKELGFGSQHWHETFMFFKGSIKIRFEAEAHQGFCLVGTSDSFCRSTEAASRS